MFSYDWNWNVIWVYRSTLAQGLAVSFMLTLIAIIAGTVSGLLLGVILSLPSGSSRPLRASLILFVHAVKALPPLILLLLFYYWLPYLVGMRSPFWLAVSALAINLCAFVADVFRHAINGVPRPLIEACQALGMSRAVALCLGGIPEALCAIVPTMGILYIDVFKLSSLASVIAVGELMHRASEISTYSFRFLEVYATLACIYLIILVPFSRLVRRLETAAPFIRRS